MQIRLHLKHFLPHEKKEEKRITTYRNNLGYTLLEIDSKTFGLSKEDLCLIRSPTFILTAVTVPHRPSLLCWAASEHTWRLASSSVSAGLSSNSLQVEEQDGGHPTHTTNCSQLHNSPSALQAQEIAHLQLGVHHLVVELIGISVPSLCAIRRSIYIRLAITS